MQEAEKMIAAAEAKNKREADVGESVLHQVGDSQAYLASILLTGMFDDSCCLCKLPELAIPHGTFLVAC